MRRFVYFDLGNVLVNFDHQIAVEQLAALAGESKELVRSMLFDSGLQNRFEMGLVTNSEFAAELNRQLDCGLAESDILETTSAIFRPNEAIIEALEKVKAAALPMGILSNTCAAHWEWIMRQAWGLPGDWFQVHVLSYEIRSVKPDAEIYRYCEHQAGCEPRDIFFTDDRQENVQAATQRGWNAHLFRSVEELLDYLESWI